MAKILDMTSQGPERDYSFPPAIADAMKRQGLKSGSALARQAQVSPMTVRRFFNGETNHLSLKAYKRISDALHWSLSEFFTACEDNSLERTRSLIRQRLNSLKISAYDFQLSTGGSAYVYDAKDIYFRNMATYSRICQALNMTPDEFYEALLMQKDIANSQRFDKISSRGNSQLSGSLSLQVAA